MRMLTDKESELFLYLHKSLMLFTNKQYDISSEIKTIDDFNYSVSNSSQAIDLIRKEMYSEKNIMKFCDENPYKLDEEELSHLRKWIKSYIGSVYIVKHLADYSVFQAELDQKTQLYGVKGLTQDIDDVIPSSHLPYRAEVVLIPFMGSIVYDGFIHGYNIYFGSGIKGNLREDYNFSKAMNGIYCHYVDGDDLSSPPAVSLLKDQVKFSINQSIKRGVYPSRALELAEESGERGVFEKAYTQKYISELKKWVKYNNAKPNMHYAVYRETIVAVMPSKKELLSFCKEHYPDILEYLTFFKS